ncbi:hypothetical protein ACIQUZ_02555 [Streptomyces griseus]|uniref:hypothetical protein n=1 Tax=Streptomyces griseus TaxID=1911 RepID=UPI003829EDDC
MAMTLKMYEVNRTGTVCVLREEAEVIPFEKPEALDELPACEYPACAEGAL